MAIWQRALGIDLDIPDGFGNWFAGFVDGDGCFLINARGDGCTLEISLRGDDQAVLHQIRNALGVGNLYNVSQEHRRRKGINCQDEVR